MKVSVIITAKNEQSCAAVISALGKLRSHESHLETLLALGNNPSEQRNAAAQAAQGDFLLFLDDDSIVHPRILEYYEDALSYEEAGAIDIVGGPALHSFPSRKRLFPLAVSHLLSSPFGMGPFRARYNAEGLVRPASERDLILCNLLVKRSLFLEQGGFNAQLYPNEENEFLNRVQERAKIYFHPLAVCFRSPPSNLASVLLKMFRYGKGRAKHLLIAPQFWNNIFLIPALFTVFSLAVPFYLIVFSGSFSFFCLAPFFAYAAIVAISSLYSAVIERRAALILLAPWLFFLSHLAYGSGLIWGFLRQPFLRRREIPVVQVVRVN